MPLIIDVFDATENGWEVILNAFVLANIVGIGAGLLYRASAIIILSVAAAFATLIISLTHDWPFLPSLLFGFGLLTVLQIGYLMGVGIAILRTRRKPTNTVHPAINAISERDTSR